MTKAKTTYISDRGNRDVRIMYYDETRDIFIESKKFATISEAASAMFFDEYHHHAADSEFALENARETVSVALPNGTTGAFDDEYLTFTADCDAAEEEGR